MKESTKRRWLIVALAISLVPPLFLLQFPALVTLKTVMLWGSGIVGYWGIVFLLWQYLLGARQLISPVFRDLAPVLAIHKWLGKYGSLVIFLHPFMALYFYGESLLYPFLPLVSSEFERAVTLGRVAFLLMLAIWLTSAIVRDKIAFRPWKYIHYLAYICVPFVLLHIPNLGSQYMSHASVRLYFLSLLVVFVTVTLLRLRGWLNLDSTRYVITRQGKLTDQDYLISLLPSGPSRIHPRQGQYIYLRLGILSESHPFSVLDYNEETGELTVAYRVYGMYTKVVSGQPVGTHVSVSGPYGSFMGSLQPDQPVVYITGGIGITPFAYQLKKDVSTRDQWIFAANRTPESAVLVPWIRSFLDDRCVSIFSRSRATLGRNEESGHVSAEVLQRYIAEPQRYQYYLCGPPKMMRSMGSMLRSMSIPESHIHSEVFGW